MWALSTEQHIQIIRVYLLVLNVNLCKWRWEKKSNHSQCDTCNDILEQSYCWGEFMLWKQTSLSVTTFLDGICVVNDLSVVSWLLFLWSRISGPWPAAVGCAARCLKSPFSWHCNTAGQFVPVSLSRFTHSDLVERTKSVSGSLAVRGWGLGILIWFLSLDVPIYQGVNPTV